MIKTIFILFIILTGIYSASAQDIIKGLPYSISLVPKSAKQPNMRLKDGSGITLTNKGDEGISVLMGKNGKTFPFCEPFGNSKLVQVGEADLEKDGKIEIVVASRSSDATIEIKVFKKPEFEIYYKEWASFTGVTSVEFPGNGTVKLYDQAGNAGIYKFREDGSLAEVK